MKGELETTRLAKKKVRSRYGEYKYRVDEYVLGFRNEAKKELIEVIAELAGLAESNVTLEDRVQRTAVKSPVHGTIKKLMVNTVGGVIKPGMELVEIVPLEDTLLVEAKIRPADIAFLRPGLTAMVKFSAYDFSIYGGLKAKLEHISADTLEDEVGEHYYLIRVRTQKNYLGNDKNLLPIIPGMMASVEILTGKKTVLHYILKPFLRAKENALRER